MCILPRLWMWTWSWTSFLHSHAREGRPCPLLVSMVFRTGLFWNSKKVWPSASRCGCHKTYGNYQGERWTRIIMQKFTAKKWQHYLSAWNLENGHLRIWIQSPFRSEAKKWDCLKLIRYNHSIWTSIPEAVSDRAIWPIAKERWKIGCLFTIGAQ